MAKYKNAYNEEDTVEESIEQPNPEVTSSEESVGINQIKKAN